MFNLFKKIGVTILDEKWNVLHMGIKFKTLPSINHLLYVEKDLKYYRVVNLIHYVDKKDVNTLVVVEEYTDDYALLEKN